jgi:mlo protein
MADGSEVGTASLQFTPTWIMAAVGSILVLISLAAERGLHQLGMVRTYVRTLFQLFVLPSEALI